MPRRATRCNSAPHAAAHLAEHGGGRCATRSRRARGRRPLLAEPPAGASAGGTGEGAAETNALPRVATASRAAAGARGQSAHAKRSAASLAVNSRRGAPQSLPRCPPTAARAPRSTAVSRAPPLHRAPLQPRWQTARAISRPQLQLRHACGAHGTRAALRHAPPHRRAARRGCNAPALRRLLQHRCTGKLSSARKRWSVFRASSRSPTRSK